MLVRRRAIRSTMWERDRIRLRFKAIDFAGNEAVASVEFTLKAEAPSAGGGPGAPTAPGPEEAVRGAAPTMLYVGIAVAVVAGVAVAAVLLLRRRRVAGSESA